MWTDANTVVWRESVFYHLYTRSYFITQKSESFGKFKEFKATVEKEKGLNVKAIGTDRGGEFMSEEFRSYLGEHGIKQCSLFATTEWSR